MEVNNPEGVVLEQHMINRQDATQVAGGTFPWKRTWDEVLLEELG